MSDGDVFYFYRTAKCQCGRHCGGYDSRDLLRGPTELFSCPSCLAQWSMALDESGKKKVKDAMGLADRKRTLAKELYDIQDKLEAFRDGRPDPHPAKEGK